MLIPPDATVELRTVPIACITIPDNHCGLDLDHIDELHRRLGNRLLPPVLVQAHEHGYWLIEGRHRYVVTLAAGRDVILAVVTDRIEVVR